MQKLRRVILELILVVIILAIVFVQAGTSAYTTLKGDDFSHATDMGMIGDSLVSNIKSAWEFMIYLYETWQGTYFTSFIKGLLSPLNHSGLNELKIIMTSNAVILILSAGLFLYKILQLLLKETDNTILLSLVVIILLSLFCFRTYSDVFYWFSGAVAYSMPLSSLFISLYLFIAAYKVDGAKMNKVLSYVLLVLASIFGFMAMGGSLTVSFLGLYFVVILTIELLVSCNTKCSVKEVLPILLVDLIYIVGVFINGIAPGNYLRHAVDHEAKVRPIRAILQSLLSYIVESDRLLKSIVFLFVLLVFILGVCSNRESISTKKIVWRAVFGLFLPLAAIFPVSMGYSGGGIPLRCMFVINFAMILYWVYVSYEMGTIVSNKYMKHEKRPIYVILLLIIILTGYSVGDERLAEIPLAQQSYILLSGELKSYYRDCCSLYDELAENADKGEKNVVLNYCPKAPDIVDGFYLSDNKDDFSNLTVAMWYGFDSIVVEKKDSNE